MLHHLKSRLACRRLLYLLNARIAELDQAAARSAYQMIVLAALVRPLEVRHIAPELVLHHEAALQQEVYRVIERGAAHPIVLVLHKDIQRFNVKMAATRVYLIQNGKTLRRLAVRFLRQKLRKYVFYSLPRSIFTVSILLLLLRHNSLSAYILYPRTFPTASIGSKGNEIFAIYIKS